MPTHRPRPTPSRQPCPLAAGAICQKRWPRPSTYSRTDRRTGRHLCPGSGLQPPGSPHVLLGGLPPGAKPPGADPNHVTIGAWLDGELVATGATASRDPPAGPASPTVFITTKWSCGQSRHLRSHPPGGRSDCHDPELLNPCSRHLPVCSRRFGGTELVIEVNPRHAGYYRRTMGFQDRRPAHLPRVNAPAVLLHRTLGNVHY